MRNPDTNTEVLKRIATASIMACVIFLGCIGVQPKRAEAQTFTITHDPLSYVQFTLTAANSVSQVTGLNALVTKGYILDPLAFAVSKAVINSIVQSTVRWINSGFNGSPSFVTNLSGTLLSIANSTADSFVQQLLSNGGIKSPFQTLIGTAVAANYNLNTNGGFFAANPYTLNQVSTNDKAFLNGDFSQGGFDAWFSAVTNPSNNPYGAYQLAKGALNSQVAGAAANQQTELNWGKGFLSYKGLCNAATAITSLGSKTTSLSGNNSCSNANIITPGAAIEGQLEKVLGSGIDQLISANQFNQIVNALVGQLTNQVLGATGLSGLSQPSSSGSSYLDQISASQTTVNSNLSSSFSQTISGQLSQLQQFQINWNRIGSAAQNAKSALSTSSCFPDAAETISTSVQPVLAQAQTELSQASAAIAALTKIQNESTTVTAANATAGLSQASSDYSALLASNTLPSAGDIQNAITQSTDTGTATTSQSLYTQMMELAITARTCVPNAVTQSI